MGARHEEVRKPDARRQEPEELALMRRLRTGDASALEPLLFRYWDPLVRYATRIVSSVDIGEDVVQDAFARLWANRRRWKPTGSPRAFLYRIVRNLALKERRRERVRERGAPLVAPNVPGARTPFEITAQHEFQVALQRAISELPPRRREAFVLSRYHDLSLGEVAEIMGLARQTVANHVSLAVADLRRALRPFL